MKIHKWRYGLIMRIFDSAVECGILSLQESEQLKHCYTSLRNKIHHLNLLRKESVVEATEFVKEREFVRKCGNHY